MKKITAVFFDLDETLIENRIPVSDLFARIYFDFSDILGAENKAVFFDSLKKNTANLWESLFDSTATPEQQFQECFAQSVNAIDSFNDAKSKEIGFDMFNHYLHLSSNNVRFHDDAIDVLNALNSRGLTTGLITNGLEDVQLGKINTLDIENKVDYINISAQARAHKPHSPVFELALKRASVEAHECLMVGDHPLNDVAGAIRAGIDGIYYNPNNNDIEKAFAGINERPVHQIQSLSEVLDLI